jgi:hypothetical protein
MKTPSLEEVKAYFKDAKEVRCLFDGDIYDVSNGKYEFVEVFFGVRLWKNHNNYATVYKDGKCAEIISYKDKTDESAKKNPEIKQYKHIPSDYIWNLAKNGKCYRCDEFAGYTIPREIVENSSDWEEVKPKEYEILSFCYTNGHDAEITSGKNKNGTFRPYEVDELTFINSPIHKIHSVKRLSDGEVFTVGDKVKYPFGDYPAEIKKIIIVKSEDNDVVASICEGSLGKVAFCVDREVGNLLLENAVKAKNPVLFTTEDGVEIRQGEKFYVVDGQYGKFKTHETIGGHFTKEHKHRKRFSSKSLAEEYVLMNKPCLSVNDVLELNPYMRAIKNSICELAKSKISDQQ